jgi:hypothetical protein
MRGSGETALFEKFHNREKTNVITRRLRGKRRRNLVMQAQHHSLSFRPALLSACLIERFQRSS